MKKFAAIISTICTTITLIICVMIYIEFEKEKKYVLTEEQYKEVNQEFIGMDSKIDNYYQNIIDEIKNIHIQRQLVLDHNYKIISISKSLLIIVFCLLVFLFHLNLYTLVVAFQEKKNN